MSPSKNRLAPLLFASFVLGTLACSSEPDVRETSNPSGAAPRRVVSLAPAFTEMIYALGAEDRLVGVTPYCKFPPAAQEKTKVGALVSLSYERLLELRPDLVIVLPGHDENAAQLDRLGMAHLTIRTESIEDIHAAIEKLGDVLDRRDAAEELVARLREELGEIAASVQGKPRPSVLFVVGRNPGTLQQIYTCGAGSFLDELMRAAGARNVLTETTIPWPVVSKESILKLDPDVILDASIRQGDTPLDGDAHMQAWAMLDSLSAVRNGRVIAVEDEHLTVPGPWIAEGARMLARLIHDSAPEADDR